MKIIITYNKKYLEDGEENIHVDIGLKGLIQ